MSGGGHFMGSGKKHTVVLLRWVLIIAFSYLLLLDASTSQVQGRLVVLIAIALASNLLIGRLPDGTAGKPVFDCAVALFDAAWVTLGLIWAPNVSGDLFLLYFLVIFVAAMGESLLMIVGSAALVSIVYGTLSLHQGGDFNLTTTALLRVPFLFVVALFYGYFVSELRGRRGEALEARLRDHAKSELLAAVSHDLRGPLGNAENLLALVLDSQLEGVAPDRTLLLRAHVNVRRVSSLVTNLLQAACIEAGQVHFQRTPVQLNDVATDVVNLESGAAFLKHITLQSELARDLPMIALDHLQLGRIIANLVSNAVKYTQPGGAIMLRTTYDVAQVYLSVEDSGPGMSAEQCEALFAPYRRVHLGGYTPGTGLGLYIAKRLTEAQAGTVRVVSELGVGSTFTVSFPRAARSNAALPSTIRRERPVETAVTHPAQPAAA
jgi:signal transduction histidine kinase